MATKVPVKTVRAAADAVTQASALLDSARLRAWDNIGLTVTQLRLLGHLNDQDGLGNADLADRLDVTRPSVSALLERLERGGFIRREISLADRRGIRIQLEPKGREAINSTGDDIRAAAAAVLSGLTDEQTKQLTESFVALSEAASANRKKGA